MLVEGRFTNVVLYKIPHYFSVELWSSEADLSGKDFLSFSQFIYSCLQSSGPEAKKKFSSAARSLQSPLLDSVADTSILIEPGHVNMNQLSKIGNENR